MSRPDTSIDPRILISAKTEFLAAGYERASLKTICAKAEVTTGALYKRYKGKEELFCAVVRPTLDDFGRIIEEKRLKNVGCLTDEELMKAWDMDEAQMLWWFEFLFKRRDGFVLLLRCSQGSSLSNFAHDWVVKMTDCTYEYFQEAKNRKLTEEAIDEEEMHILLSAFWTTVYEPFVHDFSWEQIVSHCQIVCRLFDWYRVLGFKKN